MGNFFSKSCQGGSHQDYPPAYDDGTYVWQKAISKNGVPYEIGRKITNDTLTEKDGAKGLEKSQFGLQVNWPVANKDWKDGNAEVKQLAAISRYRVSNSSAPFFDYFIEITNTETYNYTFYDQSGDHYDVNTLDRSDHVVRYNSPKPTILFVTGK